MIGISNYSGDFTKTIDFNIAQEMIDKFVSAPISYALDIGLTSEGKTVLVEVNDAYSLGCYGLSPILYTQMIMDRWEEIMKNGK